MADDKNLEELDARIDSYDRADEVRRRQMYLELLEELEPNPWEYLERMVGMLSVVLLVALVVAVRDTVDIELVWLALGIVATLAGVPLVSRITRKGGG